MIGIVTDSWSDLPPELAERHKHTKPLLAIEKGAIEGVGRASSRFRALAVLIEWLGDRADLQRLAIVHGDAADMDVARSRTRDNVPGLNPTMILARPALAIQAGPKLIGLAAGRG